MAEAVIADTPQPAATAYRFPERDEEFGRTVGDARRLTRRAKSVYVRVTVHADGEQRSIWLSPRQFLQSVGALKEDEPLPSVLVTWKSQFEPGLWVGSPDAIRAAERA